MINDTILIVSPSFKQLALNLSSSLNIPLVEAEIRTFTDGENKVRIKENLSNKRCIVIQPIIPPDVDKNIMQTLMILKKCQDDGAARIILTIPYMPYTRQDKAFLEGEVISIDLIAKLIEFTGVSSLITVDIHSMRALSYYSIDVHNVSAIPLLADYMRENFSVSKNKFIAVSPDQGGIQRAKDFANLLKIDMISFKKTRDKLTGEVIIDYEIPTTISLSLSEKDVIIVDDMISTGGTIVKACDVLKANNCQNIYVVCSHALLLENAHDNLLKAGVKEIISTNSIPNEKIRQVDISPLLHTNIVRILKNK
ncbi:MAG TPA: ribose-phosphate pyrophosphokinase [Candidatus Nitrosocosmicus sp.]|nr:ribose-phosphate pyrophosphokinase [Candidatus Nitrosocosmicus sp.]